MDLHCCTINLSLEDLLDGKAWYALRSSVGLEPKHGGPATWLT